MATLTACPRCGHCFETVAIDPEQFCFSCIVPVEPEQHRTIAVTGSILIGIVIVASAIAPVVRGLLS